MSNKSVVKEKKDEKATFLNAIVTLQKSLADFKKERKSEWRIFKHQFNEDMNIIQKTLKTSKASHKK